MASNEPVSRRDHDDDLKEVRGDMGVLLAQVREEWRNELKITLGSFRNEMRVLLVGAVIVLRFDIPSEFTAAALLAFGGKVVFSAFARN